MSPPEDARAGSTTSAPLLTGYDAKRCQRRVHNDHDPTLEKAPWEPSRDVRKRLDDGIAFEDSVFDVIRSTLTADRWRDLTGVRGKQATITETLAAMDSGVELILGGWLPDDIAGGRTGRPDLLLRIGPGYVPGDVKGHKAVKAAQKGMLTYSSLAEPGLVMTAAGLTARSERIDDFLQLAHYWRMLESAGRRAEGPARGFIIGTDARSDLDPSGFSLTWFALDEPLFTTFSRTQGKAKRTALERYDFEHGIRLDIARIAESRTGSANDPDPLVIPIFIEECNSCPWHDYCHDLAGDSASAYIKTGRLDIREWRALGHLGITTLDDLANLDPNDAGFQTDYLPEVSHRTDAIKRLSTAVRRGQMVRNGVSIERDTTGPVDIPRADVEIDFDLEDAEGHVYLWGALVTDRDGHQSFEPTISFEPLDDESERALAHRFVGWLRNVRDEAAAAGKTVLAYHYTSYERDELIRLLGEDEVIDVLDLFVDLYRVVAEHYFGAAGLGLKKVAPAFGFAWRDEEPSGLLSQLWYLDAIQNADPEKAAAARTRLLNYNEDDVRATLAVRRGISET